MVSDDGNLLAYTTDFTGFRQYALHVKDLRTGATLPDTTERVTSRGVGGRQQDALLRHRGRRTKRSDKLWRHVLGATAVELIYEEKDELYDIGVGKTRDKQYLLLGIEAKDTSEVRYLRADQPAGALHGRSCRARRSTGTTSITATTSSTSAPTTTACNFRVVTAPVRRSGAEELEGLRCRTATTCCSTTSICSSDFAVSVEKREALNHLRIHDFARPARGPTIAFPEPVYAAFPGGTPEFESHDLPLQLPELRHALQRLRLRHAQRASRRC